MSSMLQEALNERLGRTVFTVTQLNLEARSILEASIPLLWIEGEISNLSRPASGHCYFSLKDERCQVRCALFRLYHRRLSFCPENGAHVLARARVSIYPERGDFQLIVEYLEEAGTGALRRAFESLKQRLAAEGLFDEAKKQPLPTVPTRLGVITSPTGAAIRDILSIAKRRSPSLPILIYPVPVQGTTAAPEIARMLSIASARRDCDALILARGGGSLEDLWAFNDEGVARAIASCEIPIVTGIGHEIDFTIADLAADRRAPTPSAAAELMTPDQAEWQSRWDKLHRRLTVRAGARVREQRQRLEWIRHRLVDPRRRLLDQAQRVDELTLRLFRTANGALATRKLQLAGLMARMYRCAPSSMVRTLHTRRTELRQRLLQGLMLHVRHQRMRLEALHRQLEAMNPVRTLDRGYAIVTRRKDGAILRSATSVQTGEQVHAWLARGSLQCSVDEVSDARGITPTKGSELV
jgi:exodeoxyribonuclease VII large subunit